MRNNLKATLLQQIMFLFALLDDLTQTTVSSIGENRIFFRQFP